MKRAMLDAGQRKRTAQSIKLKAECSRLKVKVTGMKAEGRSWRIRLKIFAL